MHNDHVPGFALDRKSRYYLDPTVGNGQVKVIKPADPEKLAAVQDAKKRRVRDKDFGHTFNKFLSKEQLTKMKENII